MRVLFATSEIYPLIKTGGLADVSHSLPLALTSRGHEVKVVLPYYRQIKQLNLDVEKLHSAQVFAYDKAVTIYKTHLPDSNELDVWLVDAPDLFDREGGPYTDSYNKPWGDSAYRFALFSRVVALLGCDLFGMHWQPDVVHCNDWQTGLAVPLLQLHGNAPATVFTIHNLAYQGNFSREEFEHLHLPEAWWSIDGIEFYEQASFLKAGALHADWVNTVSPSYADEVRTPELGEGFDGILRHRGKRFVGILNGVDYDHWDPSSDAAIAQPYSAKQLELKPKNKGALQTEMGLPENKEIPLFGMVCRMAYQKGIDLLIDAIPLLMTSNLQIVVLGSGDIYYEEALKKLARRFPEQVAVSLGYDESLAHRIEAGADFFLMPSRYEPCGLNQIYSLRYGTLPIVRKTGGLADTVIDPDDIRDPGQATGFCFEEARPEALVQAIKRALELFRNKAARKAMQLQGMSEDFSWEKSCIRYEKLYTAGSARRRHSELSVVETALSTPSNGDQYEPSEKIPENKTRLQSKV